MNRPAASDSAGNGATDAAIAAAVAPWLADARWFAAKGRAAGRIDYAKGASTRC